MKKYFSIAFAVGLVIALLICNMIITANAITAKEGEQLMIHPAETIASETTTNEAMNHSNMVENALQDLLANDSISRMGWALAMFIIALALIGWALGQVTWGFAQLIIALTGVYTAVVQNLNSIINAVDMALTKTIHYFHLFDSLVNTVVIKRLSATTDNYLRLAFIAAVTSIPFVIMAVWSLIFILVNSNLNIGIILSLLLLGYALAYPPIKVGMLAWDKFINKKK